MESDVSMVEEIIKMRNIIPIPKSPPFVEGIINLRGLLTSTFDLRKRFDLEANFDDDTRIIIIDGNNRPLGVVVDSISEVLTVSENDMESADKEKASKKWHTNFVKGVVKLENRLLPVLDFNKVIRKGGDMVLKGPF